jgi:hypothetical protein
MPSSHWVIVYRFAISNVGSCLTSNATERAIKHIRVGGVVQAARNLPEP